MNMIDAITRWVLALIIVVLGSESVFSTPVWSPQVVTGGFGRNIRHLPCVSRRTGETGVCMFAYSCAKANGTHLGTCIDRFYFGSCCKVPTSNLDLAAPLDGNNISEESVLSLSSTESYLVSTHQTVQLVKNTSETFPPSSITTAEPKPDILPPVRKPSKPQISTTISPLSNIFTKKPPNLEVIGVSSTTAVYSKTTAPTIVTDSISTNRPSQSSITSLVNNYSKPTKKPPINQNSPPVKPTIEKPGPKPPPVPVIKPEIKPPVKPTRPTIKPISSLNKPTLGQSETKPSPSKPASSTKPKPQISTAANNKIKPNIKPTGDKTNQSSTETLTSPTKKPSLSENKPVTNSTAKPPVKVPKPSQKPLTASKPIVSSKPVTITKPSKPSITSKPSVNLTSSSKPVLNKPTNSTKPLISQKPIPISKPTTTKPSSPTYIKVPLTSTPTNKITVPATTISNEILPNYSNFSTVSSVEFEEEVSNLIHGTASPMTDSPPALVTWTTVNEVPVKPVSKPGSTPVGPHVQNKTKVPESTTVPALTMAESWVEVSVSTHEPSSSETLALGTTPTVLTTVTSKPIISIATSPTPVTTVSINTTESPSKPTTNNISTSETSSLSSSTATSSVGTSSTTEIYTSSQSNYTDDNEIETANLNTSNYIDVCGRRLFPQSRIVGGDKATFGKWPWQISLRQWRTSTYLHKCGAALLNENWAITAAHCVENVPPSDLLLRLGEHDLSLEDEPYGYQERRVQIVASHPQFDSRTFEYDLALLRFYEPVTFQPNIIPVCVPQDDTNFVGSTAYVTGWGRLYEDGPLPSVLQEVSVPVINNTVCETMYRAAGYIEHIPEIFICAGWKKGGFDSCEGDSGGPMVIQRPDKRWLLAGVISWGIGCAEPNQPGVYTRISEFREWINQILQF